MTTSKTFTKQPRVRSRFRLPDIPQREADEVTQYDQLFDQGLSAALALHLGNPETTLVSADHWVVPDTEFNKSYGRYPDLLVAFDVDRETYRENNGYIITEQGKPPDWVMEVASASTGSADVGVKREYYRSLSIGEYWRFDETGEHHGTRLAGDLLVDGEYVAANITELPNGSLQGYSPALNLYLRWEAGELVFHDPVTGRRIATHADERTRADAAEARADAEQQARTIAESRADAEKQARAAAEARIRELEEQLRQQEA